MGRCIWILKTELVKVFNSVFCEIAKFLDNPVLHLATSFFRDPEPFAEFFQRDRGFGENAVRQDKAISIVEGLGKLA